MKSIGFRQLATGRLGRGATVLVASLITATIPALAQDSGNSELQVVKDCHTFASIHSVRCQAITSSLPERLAAQGAAAKPAPNDPMVLLLKGIYAPAVNAPNLGLPGINLNDGTWIVTEIHSVTTVPGSTNQSSAVVGHFYAQTTSALVAYDLPGGALLMEFTAGSFDENPPVSDGNGGVFLQETWDLTILKATGIYSQFAGGHNHMVDRFDALANGLSDESCFCIISVGGGLPLWWTSND